MGTENIDATIDRVADAAKQVTAAVDETAQAALQVAANAAKAAQIAVAEAVRKSGDQATEHAEKAQNRCACYIVRRPSGGLGCRWLRGARWLQSIGRPA